LRKQDNRLSHKQQNVHILFMSFMSTGVHKTGTMHCY